MNKTSIEWVKNPDSTRGYTWNPITGCLNNCSYCYARKLANTRLRERYLANKYVAIEKPPEGIPLSAVKMANAITNPFYPRFWEGRLTEMALFTGTGKGIFVCDMADLFGIGTPSEWTRRVLDVIRMNQRNRFYLLTKQPQNLIKFSPFPDNCWVGVTIVGGGFAIPNFITLDAELGYFYNFEAKVKFISFEPLLYKPTPFALYRLTEAMLLKQVNWVIIGSQTKPYKPPKIEWVQEIVEACDKAGIPVFLKNNLFPLFKDELNYLNESWLRQEIPR